ncbi:Flagellum-specific ATP synthase [[Clostridium] cellulosi]|uniref:Flagellum-specific ATP synthase n=1 Tax=[Clostridium] cellulosi TaxID=29343 RepID=A0A078KLY2_9FIRM|nr:MAG: flagellar protein export ATPase FliI [[Clostridium] cellulosi]CDZ23497.1 Flagellum-specific ATP synthase [[Clostridium] cellulosi]
MAISSMLKVLDKADLAVCSGSVDRVTGLAVESVGPPVNIGEVCKIYPAKGKKPVKAEVVGFRDKHMLLMPFDTLSGIGPGSRVESTGMPFSIPVGMGLRGRILDGLGTPIDGKGPIEAEDYYNIDGRSSNPLTRPRIKERINLGVKAIDGLLTCGRGQRIGIFAGSGVGKSTLLGMIARNASADINVIGLVGERGREVRDFIERDLKEEGMKKSVIVVATSDRPAMARIKCALVATTIAEFFRDKGMSVMLMMDSLTRFAMAQREVGLATGEAPVSRGYTPSIFAMMPQLLERSGNFDKGSITAIYTVLVEGDDMNEPVADTVRGILDGHIVLTRGLAMKNHYPAIDVLRSVSRLMSEVVPREHLELAGKMRNLMATYENYADLISIGAYKNGSNPEVDMAIKYHDRIENFLKQWVDDKFDAEETYELMKEAIA